jgi:glycosyltransferase involved in cell wall biosynthesis
VRLLIVNHGYPPFGLAGVERVSEQTARTLVGRGHEVTVLTRRPTPAPPLPGIERAVRDGVGVVRIVGSAPAGPMAGHLNRLDRIFERLLLELKPDVVLISHLMYHSPGYATVAHRWGVPVVMELHDFYTACERAHLERVSGELCRGPEGGQACAKHCFANDETALQKSVMRTLLFRRAAAEADALVVPSRFVADYFREHGLAGSRMHVVPNGVALAPPQNTFVKRPHRKALHLASLGVLVPHKGAHVVLDALRKARLPTVRYTLFGDITQPYTRELRSVAEEVDGLELRTYGRYEPESLPALLAEVDALIIPSLVWETFSIVAREAMCCGVPVIASRLGALSEAVREGENGLLFAPGSSSELAALLRLLDADRALLEKLGKGIVPTDWISTEDRTQRLEEMLEDVCAAGPNCDEHERNLKRQESQALRALLASSVTDSVEEESNAPTVS